MTGQRDKSDPYSGCTDVCEVWPRCSTCGRTKRPIGRTLPLEASNGYCDDDCNGYRSNPWPGHLFPGELAEHRAFLRCTGTEATFQKLADDLGVAVVRCTLPEETTDE